MLKFCVILVIFAISLNQCQRNFRYCSRNNKIKALTRGYYKNVMSYDASPLLTSRKQNLFVGVGKEMGILLRNEIYSADSNNRGTYMSLGKSIIIELLQVYQLNTLKLMLRNGNVRTYDFIVYASDSNKEIKIFDSITYYIEVVTIKFPNQFVKYFRIYNRGGNSDAAFIHIIKAEAYFKF
ncbi:unnamed protein product [Paramecium primaurelia]|uniref:Uncharacterized protein n=1 Tax=Paramecium primaurelia TaxID=5886 RepID=A0A8S1L5T9_PARPR|nr:unnamed protein product [Paramecium primaurelia]